MKHSLIVVKQDGTIEGVISLTDIFSFLLNSGPPKAESRIAALKADLEEMQVCYIYIYISFYIHHYISELMHDLFNQSC